MRAHSMRPPPFARRSTMGTTDRSKKRRRRCAARPRSDGITTRLSCSFNFLAIRVFRQTYGVFDPFGFEELVDLGIRKAGVGPKINARDLAPVTCHDWVEHFLPAVRAVHVAGTQSAAFQIAKLVEHEQRMIT